MKITIGNLGNLDKFRTLVVKPVSRTVEERLAATGRDIQLYHIREGEVGLADFKCSNVIEETKTRRDGGTYQSFKNYGICYITQEADDNGDPINHTAQQICIMCGSDSPTPGIYIAMNDLVKLSQNVPAVSPLTPMTSLSANDE